MGAQAPNINCGNIGMGTVVRFPARRHARVSTICFAANRAKSSADRPADFAVSVSNTRIHQSDGMVSRIHHLRTTELFLTPTSTAIASRERQRSMTDRKDVSAESLMPKLLGPFVPKRKAIMSHDSGVCGGHLVPMGSDPESIAESRWREGFRERIRIAQGGRTQETMARLLGISRDAYAKYVGSRGTVMPVRLLPKFCDICDVDLGWLIDGGPKEGELLKSQHHEKRVRRGAAS